VSNLPLSPQYGATFGNTTPYGDLSALRVQFGAAASAALATPMPTLIVAPQPTFDPKFQNNALYGKPKTLFAGGLARIGAAPAPLLMPKISGGLVTFVVWICLPVPIDGSRVLFDIAFDNEIAWRCPAGGTQPSDGTIVADVEFDFTFTQGRLDQEPVPEEYRLFPGDENAYRPACVLEIRGLPYKRYMDRSGRPIPYVAPLIGDTTDGADPYDGINLGLAMERIAQSPWCGYTSATYETSGITDVVGGVLISQNFNIVQIGQALTGVYPNIDQLVTDKIRLIDRGSNVSPDFVLDHDNVLAAESIVITRAAPSEQARQDELATIDPDQDYMTVSSLAQRPRNPFAVSAAVGKNTTTLPVVMDAPTRQALVIYGQHAREVKRKGMRLTVTGDAYAAMPADLAAVLLGVDGIDNEIMKVIETTHGPFVVQLVLEAFMRCGVTYNPTLGDFSYYENTGSNFGYTFNGSDLGPAAADRNLVFLVALGKSISPPRSVATITIDGVDVPIKVSVDSGPVGVGGEPTVSLAIGMIHWPSGTTGDVAIAVSGGFFVDGCTLGIYPVTGLASFTPFATASVASNGSDPALTIDTTANGIVIAGYAGAGGTPGAVTWTGLSDKTVDELASVAFWVSHARQGGLSAQTARAIAAAGAASGREAAIAISLG
jgi:hypothetical protein